MAADARQTPRDVLPERWREADADADQPGHEEALDLRVGAREPVESVTEDGDRLIEAMEIVELTSEKGGDLGSALWLVDQLVCFPQMLGGSLAVHESLSRSELEQHVDAPTVGRHLSERAAEVRERALGRTA